jgi:FKBP-type peptidyl-prolyl cis-trans isomerase (trigger factor)
MVKQRLLDNVELEMPESLVERADQRQQARMLVRLLRSGVPRDEAEQRVAQTAQGSRQVVTGSLKADFILRQIAEQETILVTESEVDSQIRAFAGRQGWRENRARDYLEEQGMLRTLRDDMRESKTLDFLIENAEVQEIPVEQFQEKYGAPQAGPEQEPGEE